MHQDIFDATAGYCFAAAALSSPVRLNSAVELEYLKHGGILPYVLREIMATTA